MNILALSLKIVIKLILLPPLFVITLLDRNIAKRIISNNYNLRDILPHLIVLVLWGILLYCRNSIAIEIVEVDEIIPIIISFIGVLLAVSITVSTFILTLFRPTDLSKRYPDKKQEIFNIVDDLRIANRIIFFSAVYIFFVWLFISIGLFHNSIALSISIFIFVIWSIMSIGSIIRGVFILVRIE